MADASARHVTYKVVEHDGGWAYKVGDVFSETFPDHKSAHEAAQIAANKHQVGGRDAEIDFEDKDGRWHVEHADGGDRPETEVDD